MKKLSLLLLLPTFLFIFSCNKKSSDQLETIAASYFDTQPDIIGFGKISIGQINDLSKIENIPVFGSMVKGELVSVKSCIDIDNYIYFGVEGKTQDDISATAFATVKHLDSLNNYLKERGYTVEKKNNLNIAEEDELIFIFDKDLIAIKAGKNQEKEAFVKTFKTLKDGKGGANKDILKALQKEAPIAIALFPNKAYNLNQDDELKAVMSGDLYDGILQSIDIQFLNGKIELTNEFIGEKDKLAKLDFINHSKETKAFKISGKDILTLALNVDFERIEKENKKLFDFFFSKMNDEMDAYAELGVRKTKNDEIIETINKFSSKDHPLTNISNGIFFLTADANKENGKPPHIKFYLGSKNTELKNYLRDLIKSWDKLAQITITKNTIEGTIYKSQEEINYTENSGASDNVFKLYVDMDYVTSILQKSDEKSAIFTRPLKDIDIYSKGNVSKLIIHTKDPNTNALEYLVKEYMKMGN